jgi:hypothetical protein
MEEEEVTSEVIEMEVLSPYGRKIMVLLVTLSASPYIILYIHNYKYL